jgi:hypothetical protein
MRALLYYRALHEMRQTVRWTGSVSGKVKFASYLVLLPSSIVVTVNIYRYIFNASTATDDPIVVLVLGMMLLGLLYYFLVTPEFFKEISFSPDLELLYLSPLPASAVIRNRLIFANVRLLPLHVAVILFPLSFASYYAENTTRQILLVTCAGVCFVWVQMLAFRTAVSLAEKSNRYRIPREVLSAIIFFISVVSSTIAIYPFVDVRLWRHGLALLRGIAAPSWAVLGFGTAFMAMSAWLGRNALRHWPAASKIPEVSKRTTKVHSGNNCFFAENLSLAVFQKDLKDLARNPAYRTLLPGLAFLLALALFAQWKAGSGGPASGRRMMATLTLIYMVPLFFSARVVSLEYRMIGFYRLILPRIERLLDLKWRVQAVVNCLVVGTLAVPFFLLVRQGEKPFEPAYYAAAVIIYVPLLTKLAIALGTFCPSLTNPPNPIGIRPWGLGVYVLLSVVLYSFLLNYMYAGTAVYTVFLVPLTILLFFRARRHLRVL